MIHVMVKLGHLNSVVAGDIIFRSVRPWEEWRLSGALHIVSIKGDKLRYERQRYRIFGNFYKVEPQYTTSIIEDDITHFSGRFAYPFYSATQIKSTKCIFKMDNTRYIIGRTAERAGKIHALDLREKTMWNETKYLAVSYLCSSMGVSGLVEAKSSRKDNGVTMSIDTVVQHKDMITCSNCLRKLS